MQGGPVPLHLGALLGVPESRQGRVVPPVDELVDVALVEGQQVELDEPEVRRPADRDRGGARGHEEERARVDLGQFREPPLGQQPLRLRDLVDAVDEDDAAPAVQDPVGPALRLRAVQHAAGHGEELVSGGERGLLREAAEREDERDTAAEEGELVVEVVLRGADGEPLGQCRLARTGGTPQHYTVLPGQGPFDPEAVGGRDISVTVLRREFQAQIGRVERPSGLTGSAEVEPEDGELAVLEPEVFQVALLEIGILAARRGKPRRQHLHAAHGLVDHAGLRDQRGRDEGRALREELQDVQAADVEQGTVEVRRVGAHVPRRVVRRGRQLARQLDVPEVDCLDVLHLQVAEREQGLGQRVDHGYPVTVVHRRLVRVCGEGPADQLLADLAYVSLVQGALLATPADQFGDTDRLADEVGAGLLPHEQLRHERLDQCRGDPRRHPQSRRLHPRPPLGEPSRRHQVRGAEALCRRSTEISAAAGPGLPRRTGTHREGVRSSRVVLVSRHCTVIPSHSGDGEVTEWCRRGCRRPGGWNPRHGPVRAER